MAYRLQVVVDGDERESFRRQAKREGLSVSAWLRRLGHRAVEENQPEGLDLRTAEGLEEFLGRMGEKKGQEPDWEEHEEAIARSRLQGLPVPPP